MTREARRLVVVADDDAAVRQLIALHLRRLGWAVLEAPDGPTRESLGEEGPSNE